MARNRTGPTHQHAELVDRGALSYEVDRPDSLPRQGGSATGYLADGIGSAVQADGVDHVVRFTARRSLAITFKASLGATMELSVTVIVNLDSDHQHSARSLRSVHT